MSEEVVDEISLCPPFRWGLVDVGVYRGSYPVLRNFRFLLRMKLKTFVSLTPEPPSADIVEFARVVGIELIHIPIIRVAPINAALQPSTVQAVNVCIDKSKHPVFIHCLDGRRITGLVVLLIRRLQGWSPVSALAEFWRYQVAVRSPIPSPEIDKSSRELEKFASEIADVIVPELIPSWLWGGDRNTSVPGIRMKYQPPLSTPSDAHSSQAAVASNGVSGTMVQDELPGIHNFVNEPPKTSAGGRNEPKVAALDSASSSSSSGIPPLGTTAVVNGDTGTGNPPSGGRAAVAAAINEGNTTERTRQQQQQRQHTNSSKRSNDYFEDSGAPSRSIQALSLHGLEGVYTRRRGGPIAIAAVVGVGTRRVPFARGITSGGASNGGGNSTGAGSVSGSSVHNNNSSNSGRSQATTTTVTQESDKVSRNQRR